ncbi:MAG: hypothetical protein SFW35_06655 [Chitinophagales bacterium]|nr:hypothetical protein [Chitinophagales bacterium]
MKTNKKYPLAFVKEMPEHEEIDISKAPIVPQQEIENLLKAKKPKQKTKK